MPNAPRDDAAIVAASRLDGVDLIAIEPAPRLDSPHAIAAASRLDRVDLIVILTRLQPHHGSIASI
jgi:hypothetical protein